MSDSIFPPPPPPTLEVRTRLPAPCFKKKKRERREGEKDAAGVPCYWRPPQVVYRNCASHLNIGIFSPTLSLPLGWCRVVTAVYIKSPMYKMATVRGGGGGGLLGFFGGENIKESRADRGGRFGSSVPRGLPDGATRLHAGSLSQLCGREPRRGSARLLLAL